MSESPLKLTERLTEYVDALFYARIQNKRLAIKGRTILIRNVLDKLRNAHKRSPLSPDLIHRIQKEEKRADLNLREPPDNHQSICWECNRKRQIEVFVDKRLDSVCKACGWVQCSVCGACCDPNYGGCSERSFFLKP